MYVDESGNEYPARPDDVDIPPQTSNEEEITADSPGRSVLSEPEGGTPLPSMLEPDTASPLADVASSSTCPTPGTAARDEVEEDSSLPVLERVWTRDYERCPVWGPVLSHVREAEAQANAWPTGVRLVGGRLYKDNLLCVPTGLTGGVVRAHHGDAGHAVGARLWHQIQRWYQFATPKEAEKIASVVHKGCGVCQACDPNRAPYRCALESTPIPPYLMDSVSVDLFAMPEVQHEGKPFDTLALCVDRESGWIVATPHLNKGLTAEKVGKAMYRQWDMFGVPSVVSSDRGPHFASGWWHTICAALGVRVAFGQAYHHQANGRAEVAGQRVMSMISKLVTDLGVREVSWVELLPKALRHIHDLPGEAGLSPYEIVFGRHRPLQGVPYRPLREAEGATTFFQKMLEVDKRVATTLNALHEARWARVNAHRRDPPIVCWLQGVV